MAKERHRQPTARQGSPLIVESQKLLEEVGRGILMAAPDSDWTRLELRLTAAGSLTESELGVTDPAGTTDWRNEIDDETLVKCDILREEMYQEGTGTWYNAKLRVDKSGNLESEFDYTNPPFDGDFEAELLKEDQQKYPRDDAHLPDWHPAK